MIKIEVIILPINTDHKGNTFKSQAAMLSYYNVSKKTFQTRKSKNWTLEECLLGKTTRYVDHMGQSFTNYKEMCEHWNVNTKTFSRRKNKGWSIEECLLGRTTPEPVKTKKVTILKYADHTGQKFATIKEMSEHWGISPTVYKHRIKIGWSIKDALTTPVNAHMITHDHLGNTFANKKEMCEFYGINYKSFSKKIASGWSLERALTYHHSNNEVIDHKGQKFESINQMCRHWNVPSGTYSQRIKNGWTIEESLTGIRTEPNKVFDHLGNSFSNIAEMCDHWMVSKSSYMSRLDRGWSLEEALCGKEYKDFLGQKFGSNKEMCEYWHVNCATYLHRKKNHTLYESLTGNILHMYVSNLEMTPDIFVHHCVKMPFFRVSIYGNDIILHKNEIIKSAIQYEIENNKVAI